MMNRPENSLTPAYFDAKYAEKLDYWDFETSPYEKAKYADSLAALPRPLYHNALELGCSIGVLTEQLATRAEHLLALEVAAAALAVAQQRCAHLPHVQCELRGFPEQPLPPGEPFDLVVVSEVGYYWSRSDLARAQEALHARMRPGAHLLLVHYTPFVSDYPLTGDEVHEAFLADTRFRRVHGHRADQYRLDLLSTTAL